jgi:hypothetical protein
MKKINPRTKDQRPRTRSTSKYGTDNMEKTNPRTKDQGPDPFPFLSNDQNNFFPKAADQRPRTR